MDGQGQLIVVVENRGPVPISNLQVTPVLINAAGNIVREGSPVHVRGPIKPGEQASAKAGGGGVSPAQLPNVRVRIDGAKVASKQ